MFPIVVKEGYYTNPGGTLGRIFDISSDGQRFLMIKDAAAPDGSTAQPQIVVVQHFDQELKRLLPAR